MNPGQMIEPFRILNLPDRTWFREKISYRDALPIPRCQFRFRHVLSEGYLDSRPYQVDTGCKRYLVRRKPSAGEPCSHFYHDRPARRQYHITFHYPSRDSDCPAGLLSHTGNGILFGIIQYRGLMPSVLYHVRRKPVDVFVVSIGKTRSPGLFTDDDGLGA